MTLKRSQTHRNRGRRHFWGSNSMMILLILSISFILLITQSIVHISDRTIHRAEVIHIYKNEVLEQLIRNTAEANGCNPNLLVHLALIESKLSPDIKIKDSNKLYSYGLYQFQLYTFTEQYNLYSGFKRKLNYEEARQYIFDPYIQTWLACQMIKDKKTHRWYNSFKKIGNRTFNSDVSYLTF